MEMYNNWTTSFRSETRRTQILNKKYKINFLCSFEEKYIRPFFFTEPIVAAKRFVEMLKRFISLATPTQSFTIYFHMDVRAFLRERFPGSRPIYSATKNPSQTYHHWTSFGEILKRLFIIPQSFPKLCLRCCHDSIHDYWKRCSNATRNYRQTTFTVYTDNVELLKQV